MFAKTAAAPINGKDPQLTPGVFLVIRTKAGHPLSKSTAKQNRADAQAYENRPYFFLIRSGFSPIGPAGSRRKITLDTA